MITDSEYTFQDWQGIFFASLEVGGDYKQFLPQVNTWLKSLANQQPLSQPLDKENLPIFLSSTLPQIIDQILKFGYINSNDEINEIFRFLKRSVKLLKGVKQINLNLINSIAQIFNENNILYKSNIQKDLQKNILAYFMDNYEIFLSLLESIIADDKLRFLNFFIAINSIFITILHCNSIKNQNATSPLTNYFLMFLNENEQDPNFFSLHFEIVSKAFDSLIDLFSEAKTDDDNKNIEMLFENIQNMISSQHSEIQKFAAHCLSKLSQNPKQAQIMIDNTKNESSSILDKLVTGNIQPEALSELQPYLQFQIEFGIINLKSLLSFWKACHQNPLLNNNQVCVSLFGFALKYLDNDSINDFLSAIQIDISPFYFNILANTIFELQNFERTFDIAISNISILFNFAIVDESAKKVLLELVQKKMNIKISQKLLTESLPLLKKDDQIDFTCSLMEKIINSSSDPSHLFNDDELTIDRIIRMTNEKNRYHIINVLFQYYLKIGSKPSSNFIKKLLNENLKDEVWFFLRNLLKNNNYQNTEDCKELYQIALKEENFQNASHFFYKFLKILIFKLSKNSFIEANGKSPVTSIHSPFYIKIKSIPGLNMMFKLFQMNKNPKTVASAKKFLLTILKSWETNNSVEFLANQTEQICIEIEATKENESIVRTLELIYDYIRQSEVNTDPEDYNSPRHFYPRNFIVLTICINSKQHYIIHFNQQETLKDLKERIAKREKQKASSLSFVDYQSNQESLSLFECGIETNSTVEIKYNIYQDVPQLLHNLGITDSYKKEQFPPSMEFTNSQFTDILLNLLELNDEKINEAVWPLLQILPTSSSISDMLTKKQDMSNEDIIAKFSDQLLNCSNDYKRLYLIQSLSDSEINIFDYNNLISILFGLFHIPFFKEDIIYLFYSHYNGEQFKEAQELVLDLIQYIQQLGNDDTIRVVFQILMKIVQKNSFHISLENLMIFDKLNKNYWVMSCNFIQEICRNNNDCCDIIFDFCHTRIISNIGESLFEIYLLSYVIKWMKISNAKTIFDLFVVFINKHYELILENENNFHKNNQNEDYFQAVSLVLECTASIIDVYPSLLESTDFPVFPLFEIAFGNQCNSVQKPIFSILTECLNKQINSEMKNNIISKMNEMINYPLERWNYNPSLFTRMVIYTGLRNLGATCFMNSIFQQMYHLFPIRYLISTYNFKEGDALVTLQEIITKMAFTIRSFVDTRKFIETWDGWNKTLINPKEQQDSSEFFLALVDNLPQEIKEMFCGEVTNFIDGIDFDFHNSRKEEFLNLSILIKNHKDIDSSFDELFQEEKFSDYDSGIDNQKINVRKYSQISKLPNVLVIQLKRFEYSITSGSRIKINDRFEFPFQINIRKLCEKDAENQNENETKFLYNLNGIVMHSGVATGGHYVSVIKKGNDWWCFNDTEVTKISEKEALNNAYGNKEGNSSAYILFYTQNDYMSIVKSPAGDKEHRLSFDEEFDYSDEVKGLPEIMKDNEIFEKTQALFGSYVIDFVQNIEDPILCLSFFIRVLCRSKNYSKANQFCSNFMKNMELKKKDDDELIIKCSDFLNDHLDDIFNNYLNCSQEVLLTNLTQIILFVSNSLDEMSEDVPNEKNIVFYKSFAFHVSKHTSSYRQIPQMLDLINTYMSKYPVVAYEKGWVQIILEILDFVYTSQVSKSQSFLTNMNLTNLFSLLNTILSNVKNVEFDVQQELLKHANEIKNSDHHKNAFHDLVMTLIKNHGLSITSAKPLIPITQDQIKKYGFANLKSFILNLKDENENEKENAFENKSENADQIKNMITDMIQKHYFSEIELSTLIQSELEKPDKEFALKLSRYLPEIFVNMIINKNNQVSRSYSTLYKFFIDRIKDKKIVDISLEQMLESFEEYLMTIIFSEDDIQKVIPENLMNSFSCYTNDNFILSNFLDIYKHLITITNSFTHERADLIIKMIEMFDKTKRIFIDYNIRKLTDILIMFPREALKGKLHELAINFLLQRIPEAKKDYINREIEFIIKIIQSFVNFTNKSSFIYDSSTVSIDTSGDFYEEALEVFKNESFKEFVINLITNNFPEKKTYTAYYNSISSSSFFNENSKKLFRIYLLLGKSDDEMKDICYEITLEAINKFDEKKVQFDTRVKLFFFVFDFISDKIDKPIITLFFNEFINALNTNSFLPNNYVDNFKKFNNILSNSNIEGYLDDIKVDLDFFSKFSKQNRIGIIDEINKSILWLYFHSTFVHENIVEIYETIISNNPSARQFLDFALQYCIEKKDTDLICRFFNLVYKKNVYNTFYGSLSKALNTKTKFFIKDENKNEGNWNWLLPFAEYIWKYYKGSYEENSFLTSMLDKMSNDVKITLFLKFEEIFFKTEDAQEKNAISQILYFYLKNCKDIIPLYQQKTKFTKEMIRNIKQLLNTESYYMTNFLKLLFEE